MKIGKPSSTAQHIALARAHLTRLGILDDPVARAMLRPMWAAAASAMRVRPLSRIGRNRTAAHVAARTLFFDEALDQALDSGVTQVVLIGAGYDSRAWRMARDGVRFFEVDHPATQADKRGRAPAGGPRYVPADLPADRLSDVLPAAGFQVGAPTVFIAEGLTQYLTPDAVAALLQTLAELGGPASRLLVNFGLSAATSTWSERAFAAVLRMSARASRERFVFSPTIAEAVELLARHGWAVRSLRDGREAAERLAGTGLSVAGLCPQSCLVDAVLAGPG